MKHKTTVSLVAILVITFIFFVPVVSYGIPSGTYHCPGNGCNFLRYGSVAYWTVGAGAVITGSMRYSLSIKGISSQGVLDATGCYQNGSGGVLCDRGAPEGSIADWYGNGTVIITYPSGYEVTCDPSHAMGPCMMGAP